MIHFNLGSHDGRTIDELTSLVEATERAAFKTKFAGCRESAESELNKAAHKPSQVSGTNTPSLITEQPAIQFIPRVLSPLELAQAEEAFHFDLRSDFDQMYGREEFEEEEHG